MTPTYASWPLRACWTLGGILLVSQGADANLWVIALFVVVGSLVWFAPPRIRPIKDLRERRKNRPKPPDLPPMQRYHHEGTAKLLGLQKDDREDW